MKRLIILILYLFSIAGSAQSVVGLWRFKGNSNDISGQANNGSDVNVTYPGNNYAYFNGNSSYILTANGSGFTTSVTQATFSLWICPASTTADQYVMGGYRSAQPSYTYYEVILGFQDNNFNWYNSTFGYFTGTASQTQMSAISNKWQLITYVWDNSAPPKLKGYLNGKLVIDVIGAATAWTLDKWLFGKSGASSNYYSGGIGEAKLWSGTLSQVKISNYYGFKSGKSFY